MLVLTTLLYLGLGTKVRACPSRVGQLKVKEIVYQFELNVQFKIQILNAQQWICNQM